VDPRIILRVDLTPDAKARLNDVCDKSGMTQVAMLSRVVEWFAKQPDGMQRLIVGHIPKEMQPEVARLVLENLTEE
jgi:hypothetical protein